MKTVYSNHQELAHVWANLTAEQVAEGKHGRCSSGSLSFSGGALVSYSTTIARHISGKGGRRGFVFDSASFSNSTSKHQNYARRGMGYERQADTFFVRLGCRNQSLRFTGPELRAYYITAAEDCAAAALQPRIRQHTREGHLASAAAHIETANRVADWFGLRCKPLVPDLEALQRNVAKRTETQRKAAERALRERAERAARLDAMAARLRPAILAAWRKGDDDTVGALRREAQTEGVYLDRYALTEDRGALLRLSADKSRVETSQGVQVLTRTVRFLWSFCYHARASGAAVPADILARFPRLDHYSADEIDINGNLRAGCHRIAYAEIEGIARELGLPSAPAAITALETLNA